MTYFRVCKVAIDQQDSINHKDFDSKEDAEHYAKNQSVSDDKHRYEVQENNKGIFSIIKMYIKGQVGS
jgi:hypothetical protein